MGELNKKWFQIVWACLLLASITINYIQRMSDALWAHSESVEVLDTLLDWIILPLTLILFVWYCVGLWRTSDRLFWRKCRQWGVALAVGAAAAVVLVLLVKYLKGESGTIGEEDRSFIIITFVVAGALYGLARYKHKHWRKDE